MRNFKINDNSGHLDPYSARNPLGPIKLLTELSVGVTCPEEQISCRTIKRTLLSARIEKQLAGLI
jgi:hypothetical protein